MIQKKNQAKIALLTTTIKASWKRSVESLIEVGRCLSELKLLLDRPSYLEHLAKNFSMSEMHAHRLENLYLHFNTKASVHVLGAKPSVLYLLTSNTDPKRIASLAGGGKVKVGNSYKRLEELSVKDISLIGKISAEKSAFDVNEEILDLQKSKTAHRKLATLIEELNDWANDLRRYESQKLEIQNKHLIKQYAGETILCLKELIQIL